MNDDELKSLFKSEDFGRPTPNEVAGWKAAIRRELVTRSGEWLRLLAACAIGVVVGASAMRAADSASREKSDDDAADDATIERVHVNLD